MNTLQESGAELNPIERYLMDMDGFSKPVGSSAHIPLS